MSVSSWGIKDLALAMQKTGYDVSDKDFSEIKYDGEDGYGRPTFKVKLADGKDIEVLVRKDSLAYATTSSALPATPLQQVVRSALGITKRGGLHAMKKARYLKHYKEMEYYFMVFTDTVTASFADEDDFKEKLFVSIEEAGYKVKSIDAKKWSLSRSMVTFEVKTMLPYVL